mmetsp:Transcript_26060/g.43471  ORF Transcript_26060/g.43471 Transcript_26060/m.43471 type:complete len:143 (+) Transcript_26060:192-620(+)
MAIKTRAELSLLLQKWAERNANTNLSPVELRKEIKVHEKAISSNEKSAVRKLPENFVAELRDLVETFSDRKCCNLSRCYHTYSSQVELQADPVNFARRAVIQILLFWLENTGYRLPLSHYDANKRKVTKLVVGGDWPKAGRR